MGNVAFNIEDNTEATEFAKMLDGALEDNAITPGTIVNGTVVGLEKDQVIIDVGLKSEGRVELREFSKPGEDPEIRVGDVVEVLLERMEDREGMTQISREKARREEVWAELETEHAAGNPVTGAIFNRVKGGFTVDLGGATAFLPGSQVDIRPVKDLNPIMHEAQPFMILKMDRARGNIVVSRRAILEESLEEERGELMEGMREGVTVDGTVKNLTDYGAFIDLGGVDGLLHVTDMSWKRINHPSEMLKVGDTIKAQVIKYNEDNGRISLGMKQLENDPWEDFLALNQVDTQLKGKVTNVAEYGAFIELEDGIEGLVHVSEMSWTKKNVPPSKIVSNGQEVDIQILEIDREKRRISLGMKQCQDNPWDSFAANHKVDDVIKGPINSITEFGLFVQMNDNIDGMVHISDISWEKDGEDALADYKKGDEVEAKILDIEPDKGRVALGIKQMSSDPFDSAIKGVKKGSIVTGTVTEVDGKGIKVAINDDVEGIIKKADLSIERSEQRPDRFAVGEKVDAKVMSIDKKNRRMGLSIKARELDEDKKAMEEYGSTESGASLGDILGAALNKDEAGK